MIATYVSPEVARSLASVTEAEKKDSRRQAGETNEDRYDTIVRKFHDREAYSAKYDVRRKARDHE